MRLAGEERLPAEELRDDAADAPHVDGLRVGTRGSQQQLGAPVPAGDDVLGHRVVGVGPRERPLVHEPRQAEVGDAQLAVLGDEQVARLEVSVEDAGEVHGLDAFEDLQREGLQVQLGQRLLRLDDPVQVAVHELHDHVELRLLLAEREVEQRYHVGVRPQQPHQTDLAERVPRVPLVVRVGTDALHGHRLPALLRVSRRRHEAEAPAAEDPAAAEVVATRDCEGVAAHRGDGQTHGPRRKAGRPRDGVQ